MGISDGTGSQHAAIKPRLISIKQAAFTLGIGRTLTYELIALGKLKTVCIGRRRFVLAEAIEEFLAGLRG